MPLKLKDMVERTKVITVTWDGETVDVSYYPNVLTPEMLEEVDRVAQEDNLDVLGAMLEPVLEWWDVLDEDDRRVPTDAATIKKMPMSFLNVVQKGIQDDQNPPESSSSVAS